MATSNQDDILARYGNWYKGSDDLFAYCFVMRNRHRILLFQGLEVVTMKHLEVPSKEHERLETLLAQPIPAGWPAVSYQGYNFVADPEAPGSDATQVAVYGVQPTDTRPPGQYYLAPVGDDVDKLVKAIAEID
jgi:hypothetical protein